MIAELRYFLNETIFDRYFSVAALPIDTNSIAALYDAIRSVQAIASTRPTGVVFVLESYIHSDFLPRVERALWNRVREVKEAEREWVRMYEASQSARWAAARPGVM